MSKKLEIIALCNIEEQLNEVESRAKLARLNIQHARIMSEKKIHVITAAQIGTQNVLYAVNQLKTDIEKFTEVTHNVR